MTHKKLKNILAKAAGLALSVSALLGILTYGAPTSAVQAADGTAQVNTRWISGDRYQFGTEGIEGGRIEDNVKIQDYIYMGYYFDEVAMEFRPILNGVLDSNRDNTGTEGAMFLVTADALPLGSFYGIEAYYPGMKYWDSSMFATANVYSLSPLSIYAKTYKDSIFLNEKLLDGGGDGVSFIRPVTKTDTEESMVGMFSDHVSTETNTTCLDCFYPLVTPYYFETEDHIFYYYDGYTFSDHFNESRNDMAMAGESQYEYQISAQLLQDHPYFLLSVEEVAVYLWPSEGEALQATDLDGNPVVWMTRTGLGQSYVSGSFYNGGGQYVAGIDENGQVIPVHVEDETAHSRLGFNLEKSAILYNCSDLGNKHQIATLYEGYRGENAAQFQARILNTRGGVVTLEYQNTYNPISLVNTTAYISIMILDENGDIKSYANVADLNGTTQTAMNQQVRTAQFTLPSNYNEDTDTLRVLWECKPDDNQGVIYASNYVDLTCIHLNSTQPTCTETGYCTKCGEDFGDLDPEGHSRTNVLVAGENTHWYACANEIEQVGSENLTHRVGETPHTFVYSGCEGQCSQCGYVRVDADRCIYNANGLCTNDVEGHYERPTFLHDENHQKYVYIEKVGHWLYMADAINNQKTIVLPDDAGIHYYYYIPGEHINVVVTQDLDFTGLPFAPLGKLPEDGLEKTYFAGTLTAAGSDHVTIKGITYDTTDSAVGLVGYAEGAEIFGIALLDSCFTGASKVGALVGYGRDVSINNCVVGFDKETGQIDQVTVSAADGTAGAFVGYAEITDEIPTPSEITNVNLHYNLAIGVRDGDGVDLAFTSAATAADALTVGEYSFCLFETDGEEGRTSAETFASGKIAQKLASLAGGWSQIVDLDSNEDGSVDEYDLDPQPFPRYVPLDKDGKRTDKVYAVYAVMNCEGVALRYTNNATRNTWQHEPEQVLEWLWSDQDCEALVRCKNCGQESYMATHVVLDTSWVPVRGDYTAYLLDPNGNYYYEPGVCADEDCPCENCDPETCTEYYCAPKPFSDTISITGIHLEDMIAMEQWVVDYDGHGIYPEDLMNNHRLNTGTPAPAYKEYEVYFVDEDGNMIYEDAWDYYGHYYQQPAPAVNVGTYDLVVVGKNDYEGQTYVYEDILVINPVVVELEPLDVYKYYDGTAGFTPSFRFLDDEQGEWYADPYDFVITYAPASSSAEGVYTIRVSVQPADQHDPANIQFVLTRDTVQAVIVPSLFVEVENKNYPTTFEYGDTIPTPTSEYFTFTEGSTLTFAWFRADVEAYTFEDPVTGEWIPMVEVHSITAIEGQPKKVGDYVLRVYASGVGDLAGAFTDVVVTITPATGLTLELDTSGLEIDAVTGYYVLKMGQTIPYTIQGFKNGETLETSDVRVEIDYRYTWGSSSGDSGFPTVPSRYNYQIVYTLRSENYQAKEEYGDNFDFIRADVYVVIVVGDNVMPASGAYLTTDTEKPMDVYISWPSVEGATSYEILVGADEDYNTLIPLNGTSTEDGNNFASVSLTRAGTYYVKIQDGVSDSPRTFAFIVSITDPHGNPVNEIGSEMGDYTVTITHEARTLTSTVTVRREITMYVKEYQHNVDSGDRIILDPTRIVMEAGKVVRLDHTLVEIVASVNVDYGQILVESIKVVDRNGNDVSDLYQLENYPYGLSHNSSENGYCVAHIFDNACDAECNVYGCTYTRVTYHVGGTATCLAQAVCEKCHTPYGEVARNNHLGTATHIAPNGADLETHLEIYSCCGQTKAVKDHVEGTPATCIDRAVCAECGWAYGEVNPANHASDSTSGSYIDEDKHLLTHLCCGASEEAAHRGGEATCQAPATCADCNHAYGAPDPHNHAGEISYSRHADHANLHVEFYACCQVTRDVPHSGGTATCTDLAVCEGCREAYGELDTHRHTTDELVYTVRSDNGSMHDVTHACCGGFIRKEYHEGGSPTCTTAAICDHCGEEYGSHTQAGSHESDQLIYRIDTTQPTLHIAYHACCGKESHREDHAGGTATCTHGLICSDCGYEYGDCLDHTFDNACDTICNVCGRQARPLVFHVDDNADGTCDHCAVTLSEDGLGTLDVVTMIQSLAAADSLGMSDVAIITRSITPSIPVTDGEVSEETSVTILPFVSAASAKQAQIMELTCVSDTLVLSELADEVVLEPAVESAMEPVADPAVIVPVAAFAWNPHSASKTDSDEDAHAI